MKTFGDSSNQHGFTLIEVLIAIAVAGIMFASLAALQISNIRVTTNAQRSTNLLEEAVTVFESVKLDVESNFAYHNSCDPCTFERMGAQVKIVGAPVFGTSAPQDGLVEVEIQLVGNEDDTLVFTQIISCIAAANPPTVADPGECSK